MKRSFGWALLLTILSSSLFAFEGKILAQIPSPTPIPKATPLSNFIGTHASFKTTDGDEFNDVTIKRITPDGIVVSYPDGIRKLPFNKLTQADQVRYGFDIKNATAFIETQKALAIQREKEAIEYQTSRIADLKIRQDALAREGAVEAEARAKALANRPKMLRGGMVASVTREGVTIMDTAGHSTFIRYTALDVGERQAFGFPPPSSHDF